MEQLASASKMSRRSFLDWFFNLTFVGWLVAMLYPVVKYLIPPEAPNIVVDQVVAGKLDDFVPSSAKIIRFGRKPVIVVRKPDGSFSAMSAVCTHLNCTVQYVPDKQIIWCACHNGTYDLDGRNISGPPPRPLPPMKVTVKDDRVIVSRPEVA